MTGSKSVAHMVRKSGMSMSEVSKAIGKHRNFIVASLGRERWNPTIETLAAIAKACGYAVVLEGHGERIEIEA